MIPALAVESALSWAWRNWKLILGGLAFAAVAVFAMIQWGDARHWEKVAANRATQIERMKRAAAEQEAGIATRIAEGIASYAEGAAQRAPIIIRSRDTVRDYAQTDAGRAMCLSAERVQLLERDDRALEAAAAAGSGAVAVPDPPAAAPE